MSTPDDSAMSLIEHLTELRNRILWCLAAFVIGILVLFPFSFNLFDIIVEPVRLALIDRGLPEVLQYTKPQEYIFAVFRVAMLGGFAVAFPTVAFHIWRFVAPGLYKNERMAVLPFILAAPVMFILGALFAHWLVAPLAMKFFIGFSDIIPWISRLVTDVPAEPSAAKEGFQYVIQGKVEEVLAINLKLIYAFGICFQMPVALTLLGKVGLVSSEGLKAARKYAIVGIMFLAAVVTPPDIVTQLILFTVVYGLYEISIHLVNWVQPKFDEDNDEQETDA